MIKSVLHKKVFFSKLSERTSYLRQGELLAPLYLHSVPGNDDNFVIALYCNSMRMHIQYPNTQIMYANDAVNLKKCLQYLAIVHVLRNAFHQHL